MQRQSFTTPTDRLMSSQLTKSHLRSHTTCMPFFLYFFLLFIVEVMLYDMEQLFGQFRLASSQPRHSQTLAYSLWGQSRKKKDLTLERVVQQQPKRQCVSNTGVDFKSRTQPHMGCYEESQLHLFHTHYRRKTPRSQLLICMRYITCNSPFGSPKIKSKSSTVKCFQNFTCAMCQIYQT